MERHHRTNVGPVRRLRSTAALSPLAVLPWVALVAATLLPLLG